MCRAGAVALREIRGICVQRKGIGDLHRYALGLLAEVELPHIGSQNIFVYVLFSEAAMCAATGVAAASWGSTSALVASHT